MNEKVEIAIEETKARVESFLDSITKLLHQQVNEHKLVFLHHELLIAHDAQSNRVLMTFALRPKWKRE
jgi:hypothetical protein